MSKRAALYLLMAASLVVVSAWVDARADEPVSLTFDEPTTEAADTTVEVAADAAVSEPDRADTASDGVTPDDTAPLDADGAVDLFDAVDAGAIEVKFIAKSDSRGRILIDNKTDAPLNVQIPDAFVGVPVLGQQFGGGGGGGGLGGGGGGGGQSVGGGGGGGGGRGGGGGGQFSIPPAETTKIDVPLLCLDHGKKNPSSSKPYKLVRADQHLSEKPAVIQLLAAFGRGELQRGAAQAAVWHANSDVSWEELAAKLDGTARSFVRSPYFSPAEIQAALAYVTEAVRRAAEQPETPAEDSLSDPSPYEDVIEVKG